MFFFSIELNREFVYEGEKCSVSENCIKYSDCRDGKCVCNQDYAAKNGACCMCLRFLLNIYIIIFDLVKNLNATCGDGTECWSEYCFESRCACPPGYEFRDGTNTCRMLFFVGEKIIFFVLERKLVNVYANSNEANASNAFCIDQGSCLEILAECRNDSGQPTMKFCQCPIGYRIVDNKRCGKKFSDRIQYFLF
jgi:hypothetical protein